MLPWLSLDPQRPESTGFFMAERGSWGRCGPRQSLESAPRARRAVFRFLSSRKDTQAIGGIIIREKRGTRFVDMSGLGIVMRVPLKTDRRASRARVVSAC